MKNIRPCILRSLILLAPAMAMTSPVRADTLASPVAEIPASTETALPAVGRSDTPRRDFSQSLSLGMATPLTGALSLYWARPISDRLVLASEFAFFKRDWVFILEPSDWKSTSVYLGTFLQYYPSGEPGSYSGYFIGADVGLAVSYQTYKPIDDSEVFFFPYVDLYLVGYTFPVYRGWVVDTWAGIGWAPVYSEVQIQGHRHDSGDFYPIADVRLTYRW